MRNNGPGVYDDECTWIREQTDADAVALIVINGNRGAGFAVQASPDMLMRLPGMLEHIARQIRAQTCDA